MIPNKNKVEDVLIAKVAGFGNVGFEVQDQLNRKQAGKLIGELVEVNHVYQYAPEVVSKAENFVTMVTPVGEDKAMILVDVELEFVGDGN